MAHYKIVDPRVFMRGASDLDSVSFSKDTPVLSLEFTVAEVKEHKFANIIKQLEGNKFSPYTKSQIVHALDYIYEDLGWRINTFETQTIIIGIDNYKLLEITNKDMKTDIVMVVRLKDSNIWISNTDMQQSTI